MERGGMRWDRESFVVTRFVIVHVGKWGDSNCAVVSIGSKCSPTQAARTLDYVETMLQESTAALGISRGCLESITIGFK